jgi:two-component system, chemotaxis family, CheB/CheR fusion protein
MKSQKPKKCAPGTAATGFPIVGIGASAGGLEAFTELLKHLPQDTGMGFVLVQHLDPQHESALSQILAHVFDAGARGHQQSASRDQSGLRHTANTGMFIERGVLKLRSRNDIPGAAHSIDVFLESLAQDQRERAIGAVLSGTATDGTLGLEAIKAESGITFAQNNTAKDEGGGVLVSCVAPADPKATSRTRKADE